MYTERAALNNRHFIITQQGVYSQIVGGSEHCLVGECKLFLIDTIELY